jgi:DnaJ-class molecular chaperone
MASNEQFQPRVDKTKLYLVLAVPFHVDSGTIRSSYKRLAVQFHPDKHSASSALDKERAASKFQEIASAFEILSDPIKRAAYDKDGMPGVDALAQVETASSYEHATSSPKTSVHSESHSQGYERASKTYEFVFGSNPFNGLPRVHNMESQRTGGSFDNLQRQRLEELFEEMNFNSSSKAASEASSSELGADEFLQRQLSSRGIPGRYSGQGWHH